MSEKEKVIMNTIVEGIPKMSEFQKGYILGIIEGKAEEKEQNRIAKEEDNIQNNKGEESD